MNTSENQKPGENVVYDSNKDPQTREAFVDGILSKMTL